MRIEIVSLFAVALRSPLRCTIPLVLAAAGPLSASPIRIMPVGDSITAGEHYGFPALEKRTGYRKPLYEMLTSAGYQVDFVGSQSHGIRPETAPDWFDWNCEAYPGWTIPQIAEKLEAALTAYRPDFLLVHVGTNGRDWDDKPSQVSDLLDRVNAHAVASDRAVTVLLCLIINRFAAEDATPTTRFNQRVASMVVGRTGDRIRTVLVDMERGAGLDYSDRLPNEEATPPDEGGDMLGTRYPGVQLDRYHPNDKGHAKLAQRLYDELVKQLGAPPDRRPEASKESSETVDHSRPSPSGDAPEYPVAYAVSTSTSLNPFGNKPRLVVLTDIGGDPDDQMSLVRLLTYANQIDIEGLVATPTGAARAQLAPEHIRRIVEAYGQVRDNLELHEPGYPTANDLHERTTRGIAVDGMEGVGEGRDSPGSELLIRVVDRDDPRPVWVAVWGGPNVLAQALWKVRATRSADDLARFVAKLRVYAISDQDDSGPWTRRQFPGLFYIVTPGVNAGGGFHHATWIAIGGDKFHGRFGGADFSLVTNEWLDRNVRRKGPLGALYPRWEFMMEGDTPSFLNLIDNGLSDPEHPNWGGWGGRYELYTPRMEKWFLEPETRPIWTNVQDEVLGHDGEWHTTNHATIWRWRSAYQNDFAARMDWTIKPYGEANHPPVPRLDHPATITARPGERVNLSAVGSSDPDGDALSYEWFCYAEAGTRGLSSSATGVMLDIRNFDQPQASFVVKTSRVMPPGKGTMHIILAVTDHGTPRLTRYERVIVDVAP